MNSRMTTLLLCGMLLTAVPTRAQQIHACPADPAAALDSPPRPAAAKALASYTPLPLPTKWEG